MLITHMAQVVLEVLLAAAARGVRFRVLVLDSRPELEGRHLLRRLLQVCCCRPRACTADMEHAPWLTPIPNSLNQSITPSMPVR